MARPQLRSRYENYGGQRQTIVENTGPIANQAANQTVQGNIINNLTLDKDLLDLLPFATRAPFNAFGKDDDPLCLPDTRVDVLQQIEAWADGKDRRHIFWLSGWAGTGKSTIARTVARKYHEQESLGMSFFFSRFEEDTSHAGKFVTSIAVQLAETYPALSGLIREAISQDRNISSKILRDQWRQLVVGPLSKLDVSLIQQPLIFVIDALDECEDETHSKIILQLFAESTGLADVGLRVLITSRPDTPIRLGFRAMPGIVHCDLVLHDVPRNTTIHDLSVFFRHELGNIRDEFEDIPFDWPDDDVINSLVQKANCLFIYASTVCRFIRSNENYSPQDLLKLFVTDHGMTDSNEIEPSELPAKPPTWELDQMYTQILDHSLRKIDDNRDKVQLSLAINQIVGSIVILSQPLSVTALARLRGVEKRKIIHRLRSLHSVLDIPDHETCPIRLLHPSFGDFLLDKQRCHDQFHWVDETKAHGDLADHCLQHMSSTLKRNMCGLEAPDAHIDEVQGDSIERCLPAELQYACLYWIHHLHKSKHLLADNGLVHGFLQTHLLHWLEVLSLIRKSSEGIQAIASLESTIQINKSPTLYAFIHDIHRFALYNRSAIDEFPLQIYSCALIFAPKISIVRKRFWDQIPGQILRLPTVQTDWKSLLQTLTGHTSGVAAVAFSPDGRLVASASYDSTVMLWDAATGAPLQGLTGHGSAVAVVAFSPDGRLVASASHDSTVRLWDAATGAPLQTLTGHGDWVAAVAFSPDGRLVASASHDSTVRLWDAATGAPLQTLTGHGDWVAAVAFSPDGRLVASASYDSTVRLWDAATGAPLQTLTGHGDWVAAVAFSPDGRLVASASDDRTVRLWDAATGVTLQTLTGHQGRVAAVAFSPDGRLVASASHDSTVRLWDAATGVTLQTLTGHQGRVVAVAFSPDGRLVASASDDSTVRLWDAATGVTLQTLTGHRDRVAAVAFSPDGRLVASASYDSTVRLWDAATEAPLQTLTGHRDRVAAVAFSPDGRLVASASHDSTVRLWDAATGVTLQTLTGHQGRVVAVAFSPDGRLVASASYDSTVRLWDAATGVTLQTLTGHRDRVAAVAFSPDGRLVASASYDSTVRLWDAATEAPPQTLTGHRDRVAAVAFSPDGRLVASASHDRTARLWDAATGAPLQRLMGHRGAVTAVAFSPDGRLVASASHDRTVMLWDAATGAPLQTLMGHRNAVVAVAFSPDGRLVASASDDSTVRLWDAATGTPLQTFKISVVIRCMSFSSDNHYLDTDMGRLNIRSQSSKATSLPSKSLMRTFVDDDWVVWEGKRLLLLSHDYGVACTAVHNHTLAMGHVSGHVSILEFNETVEA